MSKQCRFLLAVLLTGLLAHYGAFAQNNISGPLSGTLGPGVYTVIGNCEVQAGQTLTIVPGTRFEHTGAYYWMIYGRLNAEGTEAQPIEFVRQQPILSHRWRGIRFMPGASNLSSVDWCDFDYVYTYYAGGALYLDGVNITISNCTITNCQADEGAGVYAINCSTGLIIEGCTINNNTAGIGTGMSLEASSGAVVRNNVIHHNSSTNT